jgi:hypothetical protein
MCFIALVTLAGKQHLVLAALTPSKLRSTREYGFGLSVLEREQDHEQFLKFPTLDRLPALRTAVVSKE